MAVTSPADPVGCYERVVDLFATDSILPPDPDDLEVPHDREYRVRAFRKSDDRLLLRGAVRDQKPPGLYLEIDPDPLTVHHMQVDMEVAFPTMEIAAVDVVFETHPNEECPTITTHYRELVGLSIARGFTHRVRELFGGPRGCTHTTMLFQAMAPVAVQCVWSMRASDAKRGRGTEGAEPPPDAATWRMNLNTCHVWAEDGEHVRNIEAGGDFPAPVFVRARLRELGLDPDEWRTRLRG
jgi:Protein of unknown function (DUF2889)